MDRDQEKRERIDQLRRYVSDLIETYGEPDPAVEVEVSALFDRAEALAEQRRLRASNPSLDDKRQP